MTSASCRSARPTHRPRFVHEAQVDDVQIKLRVLHFAQRHLHLIGRRRLRSRGRRPTRSGSADEGRRQRRFESVPGICRSSSDHHARKLRHFTRPASSFIASTRKGSAGRSGLLRRPDHGSHVAPTRPSPFLRVVAAASIIAASPADARPTPGPWNRRASTALDFDADEGFGYGLILALYGYDAASTTYRWTVRRRSSDYPRTPRLHRLFRRAVHP